MNWPCLGPARKAAGLGPARCYGHGAARSCGHAQRSRPAAKEAAHGLLPAPRPVRAGLPRPSPRSLSAQKASGEARVLIQTVQRGRKVDRRSRSNKNRKESQNRNLAPPFFSLAPFILSRPDAFPVAGRPRHAGPVEPPAMASTTTRAWPLLFPHVPLLFPIAERAGRPPICLRGRGQRPPAS